MSETIKVGDHIWIKNTDMRMSILMRDKPLDRLEIVNINDNIAICIETPKSYSNRYYRLDIKRMKLIDENYNTDEDYEVWLDVTEYELAEKKKNELQEKRWEVERKIRDLNYEQLEFISQKIDKIRF